MTMDFNSVLKEKRFYKYDQCRCGGVLQYKYKSDVHKEFRVIVYPEHNSFRLLHKVKLYTRKVASGKLTLLNESIDKVTKTVL